MANRGLPKWCLDQIDRAIADGSATVNGPKAEPPPPIDEKAAERDFQAAFNKRAKELGWRGYHTHDSRKSEKGFLDWVGVRGPRVLWVELKTETGKPTAEQTCWMEALEEAGQEVYLFRPSQWNEIEEVLK